MALATSVAMPNRQPSPVTKPHSPGLTINLSSNNPFRNRAVSPALPSPQSIGTPTATQAQAPSTNNNAAQARMSRNPFLDDSELQPARKPAAGNASNGADIPSDIFNDLSLLDRPANAPSSGPPPPYASQPPRAATFNTSASPVPRSLPRGPNSPSKRDAQPRRARGMSETSVTERERTERRERDRERERERGDRPPRTESEERRRKERRREREERHRREKEKEKSKKDGKPTRKPQGLDIIDKLDVTGIYGPGLFHHDGPFDACNPHRNAKRDRRAPMQAFPAGSANMALGGSGPLNEQIDLDRFHGRGTEAFDTFFSTRKANTEWVDPTSRTDPIHGEETNGLGTSTFLEGAPASRKDMQRRDSDEKDYLVGGAVGGGLSRKKSLAQRFRGMSSGRAQRPGDFRSPEARYNADVFDASPPPQIPAGKSVSAGGPSRAVYSRENEVNPFDNDYETAYEKKGAQIRLAERETSDRGHVRAPSSPRATSRGLTRTVTGESTDLARPGSNDGEPKGGFLNRMRSLKGGRRPRPEDRAA